MRQKYIDLCEKALSAYTREGIESYFDKVKEKGLTEHGFPRLTVNMGIMIAFGRRLDLKDLFIRMMDFCTETVPFVKAANDFSVREMICCLCELEKSDEIDKELLVTWRERMKMIVPEVTYTEYATTPEDVKHNWVIFTAVSEFFRQTAGLCDSSEFIDLQLSTQMPRLDDNGMYLDNVHAYNHQPFVYDLVSRGLLMLLLERGYRGKYYETIDAALKSSALCSLKMQSPNGEIPYGGRSNQFLHNEAWLIAIYEYEAKRYYREGDLTLARKFKAASARALSLVESWLNKDPIKHIKNRFPTETMHGCEWYAYFDKYMITVASFFYAAYLVCDDSIEFLPEEDTEPCAFMPTDHFHKLFLKSGGYGIESDYDADPMYDASGIGRIHKAGAPAAICMSCPCPKDQDYKLEIVNPERFSLCPGVKKDGKWLFAAEDGRCEIISHGTDDNTAYGELLYTVDGREIFNRVRVSNDGVLIDVKGEGEIAFSLPVFSYDGERDTDITVTCESISVSYGGYICRYTALDGTIADLGFTVASRNGFYKAFCLSGEDTLSLKIEIEKA